MKRLSNTQYNRPPTTYQESLTSEQVKEKLQDFVKMPDVSLIPINSEVRYFSYKDNPETGRQERLFRLGGRLLNKDNHDKYVVLTNGKQTWSVNTQTSVFFRKMTFDEVHEKYESKIKSLEETIRALQRKIQKLKAAQQPQT